MRTVRFFSAAIAFVALQLQINAVTASSLKDDPVTTCTSYDLSDKNFPGRESIWNEDIAKLEEFFKTRMEMKLKKLPTSAVYKPSPWAGAAWQVYQDSINYKWNKDQPSPAEKYATAFDLDVKAFMNNVSAQNGVDGRNYRAACTSNKECFDPNVDTVCAQLPRDVQRVTFQPLDIKALITLVYDGANTSSVFTGSRYSGNNDSIDEYGGHTDYSYRDLNPGYFHIAATNLLGLLNTTFIIDRDAGTEVWNHPVVGFKVYEQTTMTPEKAAQTFYGLQEYPWNNASKSIVYTKSRLSWINDTYTDGGLVASGLNENFTVGADYDYLLELDEGEEIIGGEWLNESNDIHPDFLWLLKEKPASDTVTSIGLSYANVAMLLEKAVECSDSPLTVELKASKTT
ncbi:Transglutaminase elicitor [Phytophthora cactorum]|nr:Transglutaminase elicitor [Phytophthora cactorum]